MTDLDRELAELTGAATRYVITPPPTTIRRRATVRRRVRVAAASASALMVAGMVAGAIVLRPNRGSSDISPIAPAPNAQTTAQTSVQTSASDVPSASVPIPSTDEVASVSPSVATFPPFAKDLTQGGKFWAVYLVVSKDRNDPRYVRARDALTKAGYPGFAGRARTFPAGDLGCDAGAREGLAKAGIAFAPGVYYTGMAVYFDTKAQAEAFVAAFEPAVVGTVRVKTYCMD